MSTVYALNDRRNTRVRHRGVVHIAAAEGFHGVAGSPRPWSTRCRIDLENITLEYLLADDPSIVTCVACLGDRRKSP